MKNIFIYLSVCLTFLIFSCNEKKESTIIKPSVVKDHDERPNHEKITENKKASDSLLSLAISKGDEMAYNSVAQDFIINENYKKLLYYSLIMANKYNNSQAHFDIYVILVESSENKSLNDLDKKTKNLAMYHLIKSVELGYKSAKYEIDEIFGKEKKIKNSDYYLIEYAK
ncbi:hypothetical protein [Flavobacterium sp.]|uniref:hypothetical protein n=1 Tax=Flavobacterium sp. TaxID=239 RepID=UPI003D1064A1